MVPVERLLLLEQMLLLGQRHLVMLAVEFPLAPVLKRRLRGESAAAVPEVQGSASAAPAGAEEQGVHDGAWHELDDTRRAGLLGPRAAWAGGFSGSRAAAVWRCWGHRQRIHVLRQVVVAVGQLGGGLKRVLIGGTWVIWLWGGLSGD